MFVFNTRIVEREYTTADIKRVVSLEQYGLDDSFYGGRVTLIGETDTDVLLLLSNTDGLEVVDTGAVKLDNIHIRYIRDLAKKRKMRIDATMSREELIFKLTGKKRRGKVPTPRQEDSVSEQEQISN